MTRKILTTSVTSAALIAAFGSSAAFAGMPTDFSAVDLNADGEVTYKEFAKVVTADKKMTKTAAAQKFIKVSGGDTVITEGELLTAVAMEDQAEWDTTTVVPNSDSSLDGSTAFMSSTTSGAYSAPELNTPDAMKVAPYSTVTPDLELDLDSSTEFMSETTSGAFSEPGIVVPDSTDAASGALAVTSNVMSDIEASSNPNMKVWDESAPSGAAAPVDEPELTIDPTVGVVGEAEVDTNIESATDIQIEGDATVEADTSTTTEIELPDLPEVKTDLNEDPME